MKKILNSILVFAAALTLCSCDGYFDVDLSDQPTLDEVFSQSTTTHKYLAHCYAYLPKDGEIVGSEGWVVGRSDESRYSWYQWVYYELYRTGNYSSATPDSPEASDPYRYFNYFTRYYQAINQCTTFMEWVDKDPQDSPQIKEYMKAEARFLRVFYYYCLFRQYGPVFVWGDKAADEGIDAAKVDRNTCEENIDFMVSELDKCIAVLPLTVKEGGESEATWQGRATKGAAMALKARLLLWAASPLYNGAEHLKGMTNINGEKIFPQSYDASKWEAAAKANKDIIDMNMYSLVKTSAYGDPFKDGAASYQAVYFNTWNEETIFGWWKRTSSAYDYMGGSGAPIGCASPAFVLWGFGGIAPSLKLVDSYAMWESGRYPLNVEKSYEGQNDYSRPIVDPKSGYQATGWTEGYRQPVDADWAPAFTAHNSTVGREPRYYACVVPNGFYWPDKTLKKRFTCYNNKECTAPWAASGSAVRVGYAWRKFYPADHPLTVQSDYTGLKTVYPAFRLAEIYLNYAEACNEKPNREEAEALLYLNKVRERVGLNKIEDAYPEVKGNQSLLRTLIKKERMVEFAMDAMRHYDACRWLDAKKEYPCENWTLKCTSETYEGAYERVHDEFIGDPARFEDRDYFFPVSAGDLAKMPNFTQNYGF